MSFPNEWAGAAPALAPMAQAPPGQSPVAQLPVAQLERRFQAFAIDRVLSWSLPALAGVITWLVVGDEVWPIVAAAGAVLVLVWVVLAVVLGMSGSSPGKQAMGLRVVHHGTGTPIGVGPALLRSLVLAASGLPTFGIGVATLAWTAVEDRGGQRRGWHDHLASSVVVDVRPAPVDQETVRDDAPRHIVNLTAMRLIPAPPVEAPAPPARSSEQSMRRPPQTSRPAAPPPQASARPSSPPAPAPARTRWRVRFDHGETFVVDGLVLVGRRPEARAGETVARLVALSSADMSVSKTHAQVGPAPDGAVVVMDRGSTNGTTLVRQGVSRQLAPGRPTTLVHGDTVIFGDRQMAVSHEA